MAHEAQNKKPTMEEYGWVEKTGPYDQPSGWMFEDGEDEYFKALKQWELANKKPLQLCNSTNLPPNKS